MKASKIRKKDFVNHGTSTNDTVDKCYEEIQAWATGAGKDADVLTVTETTLINPPGKFLADGTTPATYGCKISVLYDGDTYTDETESQPGE